MGKDVEIFKNEKTVRDKRVLLLAVMLDAGPYSEQAESRLRARQAVLEGLSESGFAPVDGEHIGFVTANWPPETDIVLPPWRPGCPHRPLVGVRCYFRWRDVKQYTSPKM